MGDQPNPALQRSLRALIHPLTVAAVLLLLLNDHVLRWNWPSWWTGKLGDFAWLVFFPFVLAPLFALIIPRRHPLQEGIVAWLSFGATALVFASMKTIPAAHAAGIWLLEAVFGEPFILRRDPTDLIALVGLAVGWWIWTRSTAPNRHNKPSGWVILSLGALASIATSGPPPDTGINCIVREDETTILAIPTYSYYDGQRIFVTTDSGETWKIRRVGNETRLFEMYDCDPYRRFETNAWREVHPSNSTIQYRFVYGDGIYRSTDGGETWNREVDTRTSQAEGWLYQNRSPGQMFNDGLDDALIDEQTDNVIVAMGHRGVLVRFNDERGWEWQSLPPFETINIWYISQIADLLSPELGMAVGLLFLAGTSFTLLGPTSKSIHKGIAGLAWTAWELTLFIWGTRMEWGSEFVTAPATLLTGILIVLFVLVSLPKGFQKSSPDAIKIIVITALASALLYLLPYILWSQNVIIQYQTAAIFAATFGTVTVWAGTRAFKKVPSDLSTSRRT